MSLHTADTDFPDRESLNAGKPATTGRPLTPERAFVLQLRNGPECGLTLMQGRVEHVASGRTLQFQTTAELLDFVVRALRPP